MLDRLLNMADVPLEAAGLSVQGALGRSGGRQSGRLRSARPGPVHLRRPVRAP